MPAGVRRRRLRNRLWIERYDKGMRLRAGICAIAMITLVAAVKSGPEVGSPMPPFEARDQNGKLHTLQSLLGSTGAVLVFYRSADW